jgi:hypothetical protein
LKTSTDSKTIHFGDGATATLGNKLVGEYEKSGSIYNVYQDTFTHDYGATSGSLIAFVGTLNEVKGGIRQNGLQNVADSSEYLVFTEVSFETTTAPINVSNIALVYQFGTYGNINLQLPVDPNATCRLLTDGMSLYGVNQNVKAPQTTTDTLAISTKCEVTFKTNNATDKDSYVVPVVIKSGELTSVVEFIIEINKNKLSTFNCSVFEKGMLGTDKYTKITVRDGKNGSVVFKAPANGSLLNLNYYGSSRLTSTVSSNSSIAGESLSTFTLTNATPVEIGKKFNMLLSIKDKAINTVDHCAFQIEVVVNDDYDGDGVKNSVDNCPKTPNADQKNYDFDNDITIERRTGISMVIRGWGWDGIKNSKDIEVKDDILMQRGDACDSDRDQDGVLDFVGFLDKAYMQIDQCLYSSSDDVINGYIDLNTGCRIVCQTRVEFKWEPNPKYHWFWGWLFGWPKMIKVMYHVQIEGQPAYCYNPPKPPGHGCHHKPGHGSHHKPGHGSHHKPGHGSHHKPGHGPHH